MIVKENLVMCKSLLLEFNGGELDDGYEILLWFEGTVVDVGAYVISIEKTWC